MAVKRGGTKKKQPNLPMRRAAALPQGPVTLEQARVLAMNHVGPRARTAEKRENRAETLTEIGLKRRDLSVTYRKELRTRVEDYTGTMGVLKKRGARSSAGPMGGQTADPLQILAEGDSWFDYPVPLFGGGVIPRLEDRLGLPILNLAKAGDEVRYMLGVEQRMMLSKWLKNGSPAGGEWDVLLFSGGGNDIVDNQMALWVADYDPALDPAAHVKQSRMDTALALVRAGYEDLIELRDELSPNTHLIVHAYDFAIPDGRGFCLFGPWLEPTFTLRGFPSIEFGGEVLKVMMKQFAAMLQSLVRPNVTFLNGQGLLPPVKSSWHNELHPSKKGFDTFATKFEQTLRPLFPGRIP
jgi:hypothetical protein